MYFCCFIAFLFNEVFHFAVCTSDVEDAFCFIFFRGFDFNVSSSFGINIMVPSIGLGKEI